MSDKKLSELPVATTATKVDALYGVQGGTSKQIPIAEVLAALDALAKDIDGGDKVLSNFRFKGAADVVYDLGSDPESLIAAGIAYLSEDCNVYYYPDLTSPLQVRFPSPVAAGTAPFGMVTVSLGAGGSVTLPGDGSWVWEKGSLAEADPVIPSEVGSVFRLRYTFDPILQKYAVALSRLPGASTTTGKVRYVAGSFQYATDLNAASPKDATHVFQSTTQDGTVYLIVGFIYDGSAAPDSVPPYLTPITNPPTGGVGTQPQGLWYYYKPTQNDLDGGDITIEFEKNNEAGHIITFEVTGAHATNPIGGTAYDRSSSDSRTSIGPVQFTPTDEGTLLVAALGCDIGPGDKPDISVSIDNGFTTIGSLNSNDDGFPSFLVTVLEAGEGGAYDSPVFTREVSGVARTQLECFWLVPN